MKVCHDQTQCSHAGSPTLSAGVAPDLQAGRRTLGFSFAHIRPERLPVSSLGAPSEGPCLGPADNKVETGIFTHTSTLLQNPERPVDRRRAPGLLASFHPGALSFCSTRCHTRPIVIQGWVWPFNMDVPRGVPEHTRRPPLGISACTPATVVGSGARLIVPRRAPFQRVESQ